MATRRDVRVAFYDHLETATSGLLDPENISNEYPDDESDLPSIVHADAYRPVLMNRGAAPKEELDNGDIRYTKPMEATFSLLILSQDENEKEDIYEAVRSYFEKYEFPAYDESDIQEDVHDVDTAESNSEDYEDREPPAHGDRLVVNLGYERFTDVAYDEIETVQHSGDTGDNTTTNP